MNIAVLIVRRRKDTLTAPRYTIMKTNAVLPAKSRRRHIMAFSSPSKNTFLLRNRRFVIHKTSGNTAFPCGSHRPNRSLWIISTGCWHKYCWPGQHSCFSLCPNRSPRVVAYRQHREGCAIHLHGFYADFFVCRFSLKELPQFVLRFVICPRFKKGRKLPASRGAEVSQPVILSLL